MAKRTTLRSQRGLDDFPNIYKYGVTAGASPNPAFQSWNTGYSIKDGLGMVIHKMRITIPAAMVALLATNGEYILGALTTRDDLSSSDLVTGVSDSVMDRLIWGYVETGAPTALQHMQVQLEADYTNEPGGGRIIAPKPLYLAATTDNAGLINIYFEMIFTYIKLTEQTYRELYESMNPSA